MQKRYTLFDYGMMPCIYSEKRYALKKIKWTKSDSLYVKYKPNKNFGRKNNRKLYILSFTYDCQYDHDTVTFAALEPYGFERL